MPGEIDDVAQEFANEIAPQSRQRDVQGKFVRETAHPEPMFGARPIEGDPLTGDTSDGGDDVRLRALERDIADGRAERRTPASREPDDAYVEDVDRDPENIAATDDDEPGEPVVADDGEKYEVTVDGAAHQVTLQEALNGYVRQATFHQRMATVNKANQDLEHDYQRQQQGWAWWQRARAEYEEDLANLIPAEPNWDQEFARDPQSAHATQKIFQNLYAKLANSRNLRMQREQHQQQETQQRTQKYAIEGFSKFVMDNIKVLPDEPTLKKNIQSMRRTAMAAGFSEEEVATVYDPRMLTVLLKASRFDRMTANKPVAVIPGKGRTLTPGAATPLSGNARRSGFDDAQRRLAQTGKLQDAVDVFRRML